MAQADADLQAQAAAGSASPQAAPRHAPWAAPAGTDAGAASHATGGVSGRPPPPDVDIPLADLAAILEGHLRLGFQPSQLTLSSLGPVIRRQLASGHEPPGAVAALLCQLAELEASPGGATLALMLACVQDSAERPAVVEAARRSAERLGYRS